MTHFLPEVRTRIENLYTIKEHDTNDAGQTRELVIPAPLLPGMIAHHLQAHSLTVELGSVAETNQRMEALIRQVAAQIQSPDDYRLSSGPPIDWRINDNGSWSYQGDAATPVPGLGFQLVTDSPPNEVKEFGFPDSRCRFWLGVRVPGQV